LSYKHAGKVQAQLKSEMADPLDPLAKAEAADKADAPDGMSIPEIVKRRNARPEKLVEPRTVKARVTERLDRDQAEHQAKIEAREAKIEAAGRNPVASRRRRWLGSIQRHSGEVWASRSGSFDLHPPSNVRGCCNRMHAVRSL
jgi:hypothetical protein